MLFRLLDLVDDLMSIFVKDMTFIFRTNHEHSLEVSLHRNLKSLYPCFLLFLLSIEEVHL